MGCKLQLIAACSGDAEEGGDGGKEKEEGGSSRVQSPPPARAGHLFVAFNNATAADSVRLLEKFARELLKKRAQSAAGRDKAANDAFDGFMRNLPNLTALVRGGHVRGL